MVLIKIEIIVCFCYFEVPEKMCYAIPAKILEMNGDMAKVDYGGILKEVNISLVDDLEVGDYILIHAGFGMEKLDKEAAKDSLEIIRNYAKAGGLLDD